MQRSCVPTCLHALSLHLQVALQHIFAVLFGGYPNVFFEGTSAVCLTGAKEGGVCDLYRATHSLMLIIDALSLIADGGSGGPDIPPHVKDQVGAASRACACARSPAHAAAPARLPMLLRLLRAPQADPQLPAPAHLPTRSPTPNSSSWPCCARAPPSGRACGTCPPRRSGTCWRGWRAAAAAAGASGAWSAWMTRPRCAAGLWVYLVVLAVSVASQAARSMAPPGSRRRRLPPAAHCWPPPASAAAAPPSSQAPFLGGTVTVGAATLGDTRHFFFQNTHLESRKGSDQATRAAHTEAAFASFAGNLTPHEDIQRIVSRTAEYPPVTEAAYIPWWVLQAGWPAVVDGCGGCCRPDGALTGGAYTANACMHCLSACIDMNTDPPPSRHALVPPAQAAGAAAGRAGLGGQARHRLRLYHARAAGAWQDDG